MELLNKTEAVVTEVTYTLQDSVSAFFYKEWINEHGLVFNCALIDKDGREIFDPALLESVENFIEEL
jgi:hypothetical protein